jgi:hypothetical protein
VVLVDAVKKPGFTAETRRSHDKSVLNRKGAKAAKKKIMQQQRYGK